METLPNSLFVLSVSLAVTFFVDLHFARLEDAITVVILQIISVVARLGNQTIVIFRLYYYSFFLDKLYFGTLLLPQFLVPHTSNISK